MTMNWYEVWIDDSVAIPYLLLLMAKADGPGLIICDPQMNGKTVFATSDYEQARLWLLEDEYMRVDGRMTIGDV